MRSMPCCSCPAHACQTAMTPAPPVLDEGQASQGRALASTSRSPYRRECIETDVSGIRTGDFRQKPPRQSKHALRLIEFIIWMRWGRAARMEDGDGEEGRDVRRASLSGEEEESRYSALEKEVEEAEKAELREEEKLLEWSRLSGAAVADWFSVVSRSRVSVCR
ncbi:hypothetical protein BJY59DRAFT_701650 [Rhodotorula toruloides]